MSAIGKLYDTLKPSLRDTSRATFQEALDGLNAALDRKTQRRTQLTLRRLRFHGQVAGDFHFYPGVNVLRAGNDKGKSSVLKLIQLCLTGKNDLKRDIDGWIEHVSLAFELDGVPHTVSVENRGRPRGQLVRGPYDSDADGETVLRFASAKAMQRELETFFNQAFGLRPLAGTQKDARKASDALRDASTSYRAYFRGLYIDQDTGYNDLLTGGIPYGNLHAKILGMLLGIEGLDAYYSVEARRAHVENRLGKEERYHQRVGASLGLRDLATIDQEIERLAAYIDDLKVQRSAARVRATSDDMDRRLDALTERLLKLDGARMQAGTALHTAEQRLRHAEHEIAELETAVAAHRALAAVAPDCCPVCETTIGTRRRFTEVEQGTCLLCHEDVPTPPEKLEEATAARLIERRQAVKGAQQAVRTAAAGLEELEVRAQHLGQQKQHLQAQLRSAHQSTEEIEREIELETRYLGRLEAERDATGRAVSGDDVNPAIERLLRHKRVLDAVLRHLRTVRSDANERRKSSFAKRIEGYCSTIGFPGLEEISFDTNLKPKVRQNGQTYSFGELAAGERVRFVLAFYLGLAIATAEDLDNAAHPGLLLIDSPGKEEMVQRDFEAVVDLLRLIEADHARSIQVIVATSVPAIQSATRQQKQVFVADDDQPLFS